MQNVCNEELELEFEMYISALVSLYINTNVVIKYNTRCSYFPLISALNVAVGNGKKTHVWLSVALCLKPNFPMG